MGLDFLILYEHTVRERGPSALVAALSRGKAEEVFARFPSAAVLAAGEPATLARPSTRGDWQGGQAAGRCSRS